MDRDLVLRAQAGDQGAFSMLAETVADRLLAVARGVLGDAHLAEDATQQALLSIWRALPKLREPDTFGAWSYRVLVDSWPLGGAASQKVASERHHRHDSRTGDARRVRGSPTIEMRIRARLPGTLDGPPSRRRDAPLPGHDPAGDRRGARHP